MTGKSLTSFMESGGSKLPALQSTEQMLAGLEHGTEGSSGPGDMKFLNFSGKKGEYSLGQDREEVDEEDLFIVWPEGNRRGWVCWKGSQPIDRISWSVYQADKEVDFEDLEDHAPYKKNDGWAPERLFVAKGLDGEQIAFSTTSKSGNNAVADLWKKIAGELASGEPFLPVIRFEMDEFTAQEQTNYKPVFVIEAWITPDAALAFFNGDLDQDDLMSGKPAKKKKPAKKAAKKKAAKKKRK